MEKINKPQVLAQGVWYEVEHSGSIIHFLPTHKHPWKKSSRFGTAIHYPTCSSSFCTYGLHDFQKEAQFTPISVDGAEDLGGDVLEIERRRALWL